METECQLFASALADVPWLQYRLDIRCIIIFVPSEQKAVIGCCIAGAGKEFRSFVID